jgi:hypothetical protein
LRQGCCLAMCFNKISAEHCCFLVT